MYDGLTASVQYCGHIFQESFETYGTFLQCKITAFECKVEVQIHEFWWVRFQNRFFLIINNENEK